MPKITVIADRFLEARKLAHDNIELAQQRQKEYYDRKTKEVSYNIGERVWLHTPNKKKGLSSKLTHNWHGPFRILAKRSPVNYLLDANDERFVTQIVHVNRLKPFVSTDIRPEIPVEQEINNEDTNSAEDETEHVYDPSELAVKAIIDKKTVKNRSGRRETRYLVQWEDDEIEPSWEPLKNLHCGELLKQFESSLLAKKTS